MLKFSRWSLGATLLAVSVVRADVETYSFPVPRPTPGYTYTGWQAYNPTTPVSEPAAPNPLPTLDFPVTLDYGGNPTAGKAVKGSFLGVSIELSLAEAVIGPNASWVRPQLLNLMSTLKERGGTPVLRLGGNSQEKAFIVDQIGDGSHAISREIDGVRTPTNTPRVVFTKGILEAMAEISRVLGVEWYLGMPMNQSQPARLEIVEAAEPILGDYLRTFHLGNEPDLYEVHKQRQAPYTEENYMEEYQQIIDQIKANDKITKKNMLGGPAFCECNGDWGNEDVINNKGWLDRFGDSVNTLIVMHYPTDNCPDINTGLLPPIEEQYTEIREKFTLFANRNSAMSVKNFAGKYRGMVEISQRVNKPLVLLETNTASCNGFLGLSDAFLAALWNLDLGLQLASTGFDNTFIHLGGQAAYYNPFMAPPHNATAPFMWTVGPPMYSVLVAAEAIGSSGQARVAELGINNNDPNMGAYVVYENNQPVRLVFLNYMSDKNGGLDYTARVQVNGASSVRVRFLVADSITSKQGITYAEQTWGGYFESDGILRGTQTTETVECPGGVCPIKVPAPGVAVVFLTPESVTFDANVDQVATFVTSHTTSMHNTAAVDGLTLATSNGLDAEDRERMKGAKTSSGKNGSSGPRRFEALWVGVSAFAAVIIGFLIL
ncbi:hypothetical protein BKA62DRAFT_273394 [Auriculariales sp. MPI-PUGE-AT-0066]|nr:hypothetical protein BKA62DRAFT_273394 [Auriculariales sp. MPI-PUGE-AT-0066]